MKLSELRNLIHEEVKTHLSEIRSGRKYLFKPKDETTRPPKKRKPM